MLIKTENTHEVDGKKDPFKVGNINSPKSFKSLSLDQNTFSGPEDAWKCKLCSFSASDKDMVIKHLKTSHSESSKQEYLQADRGVFESKKIRFRADIKSQLYECNKRSNRPKKIRCD